MRLLLVGLGNPGAEYEKTYHNVGSFIARAVAAEIGREYPESDVRVFPLTSFMNESGSAVVRWTALQGAGVADVLVLHDDSDLPVGEFRVAREGGSAGHKGVQSLIDAFGTDHFFRIRIGIRDPQEEQRTKAGEFVLRRWSNAEEQAFVALTPRLTATIVQEASRRTAAV